MMQSSIAVSENERKVLDVLRFYALDGECRLQNRQISREAGVKLSAVQKALRELERKKIIRRRTKTAAPPLWVRDPRIRSERIIELKNARKVI